MSSTLHRQNLYKQQQLYDNVIANLGTYAANIDISALHYICNALINMKNFDKQLIYHELKGMYNKTRISQIIHVLSSIWNNTDTFTDCKMLVYVLRNQLKQLNINI